MRSRLKIGLVLAVVTLGVFHLAQLVSWAQEAAGNANIDEFEVLNEAVVAEQKAAIAGQKAAIAAAQDAVTAVQRKLVKIKGKGQPEGALVTFHVRNEPGSEIRQAAMAVNQAEGDEAKEAAQSQLNELLEQYFDDDMQRREEELVKIEERLAKLRELLDRRREKKQEIIDLQSKVALNEAEGLGFYGNDSPPGFPKGFRFEGMPHADAHSPFFPPVPKPAPAAASATAPAPMPAAYAPGASSSAGVPAAPLVPPAPRVEPVRTVDTVPASAGDDK